MAAPLMDLGPVAVRAGAFHLRKRQNFGLQVINKTGSIIAVNKLVAITGYDVTSGRAKIVLADADLAAHFDVWVTTGAIAVDSMGTVVKGGVSTSVLNTNSATTVGDPVYLSGTAGGFSHTAPTTGAVIPVGFVSVKSATVGQIVWHISIGQVSGGGSVGVAGGVVNKLVSFTEDATSVTHTGSVAIPAGSIVHEITVFQTVIWADTACVLKVGDSVDDDGYFIGVDMDSTDFLVGEMLSTKDDGLWGGKQGAYLTSAGRRGAAISGNSGFYYGVADSIIAVISVTTPSATTGRAFMLVSYSTPPVTAATVA